MAKTDAVRDLVAPLAEAAGADVYDVTLAGGKLVVAITRREGIDLDTLSDISRDLGSRLDDADLIGGSYTLEVTSPGLERPLRTPEHYRGAVGESVTIRTHPDTEGDRRVRGVVISADDDGVTLEVTTDDGQPTGETRTVAYAEVERARTTFSWGPAPKPGGKQSKGKTKNKQQKQKSSGAPAGPTSDKEPRS